MDVFTGVVVLDDRDRVYLIKEEDKNQINQGRWTFPGGSIDPGEKLVAAGKREVLEETGYKIKVNSVLGLYQGFKGDQSWFYVVLGARLDSNRRQEPIDPAVKKSQWFSKAQFLKMRPSLLVHPDMKQVYQAAVSGGGLPLQTVKSVRYPERCPSRLILLKKIFKNP